MAITVQSVIIPLVDPSVQLSFSANLPGTLYGPTYLIANGTQLVLVATTIPGSQAVGKWNFAWLEVGIDQWNDSTVAILGATVSGGKIFMLAKTP